MGLQMRSMFPPIRINLFSEPRSRHLRLDHSAGERAPVALRHLLLHRGCECGHQRKRLYEQINKIGNDETLNRAHVLLAGTFKEIPGKDSRLLEKHAKCIQYASIEMKQTLRSQLKEMVYGVVVFAECALAATRAVTPGQRFAARHTLRDVTHSACSLHQRLLV